MQKFRALIEECRVVLVAFQNEMLACSETENCCRNFPRCRRSEMKAADPALSKIHASIDVVVVLPCVPATTRTSLPTQKFVVQDLRQRAERNALVENALQFDIAARNCIAHDHQIGPRIQILLGKRLRHRNSQRSRKVDIGGYAAASDPVTRNPRCCSIPASEAIAVPQMPIR